MANRFLSNIKINDAYTFPASDGTNGQVIVTDGAGNLSFQDSSGTSVTSIFKDVFTGDGSTVNYTLSGSVDNELKTQVYFSGVYQSKDNYTVSGNVISFTSAPPVGMEIEVITFSSVSTFNVTNQQNGDLLVWNSTTQTWDNTKVIQSVQFDGGAGTQGTMSWNTEDETVDLIVSPDVTYQLGQELGLVVRNISGQTINNGDVVKVTGASGNKVTINIADNTGEYESSSTFAVVTETINNNSTGRVTTEGLVRGLDTSVFTEGVAIWLGTNGQFTATKPLSPNHLVHVGWVVRSHAAEGIIFVKISNGWELEELHDVLITNAADKDLLSWNATSGVWENTKTLGDITTGNITTSGTVDGVDVSLFKSDYDTHNHDNRYYTELEVDGFLANKNNWDTAYGWGDHSTQSYATQTYVGNAIAGLIDSAPATLDTLNELAAALGDDPNFATTVSNSIGLKWTQDNVKISNWDTAYGWGNHANAGYLTSFNETDPVYTSERDSLLFNKMVHATLLFSNLSDYNKPSGYSTMIQPSSYQNPIGTHGYYHIIARRDAGGGYGALLQSYNGHEIYHGNTTESTSNINWYKIWTSGDFSSTNVSNWNTAYGWGNHAGLYASVNHTHIISPISETAVPSAGISIQAGPGSNNTQGWAYPYGTRLSAISSAGRSFEIMSTTYPNGELVMRTLDSSNVWDAWKTIIDSSNIGSQSVNYANSAGTATDSSKLPLTGGTLNVNASSTITLTSGGTNASYIKAGAGDELYIGGNDSWQMRFSGANVLMDNGGYLQNDSSLRAPIFYDSNDTNYYVNPNANSVLNSAQVSRNGNYGGYNEADLIVGHGLHDRRGYGATGGSSIMLRSSSKSTITALDENNNLGQLSYEDLNWTIGEDIGWGVQQVNFPGQVNLSSTLKLPNNALVSVNNEPDVWGARFRTTTSTSNLGSSLKNLIWTGGGSSEGFAVMGSGFAAAFEVANSGAAWASSSFRAPIFYDSNNTGYYLNPAEDSNLVQLTLNGAQFWRAANGGYQRADSRSEDTYYGRTHWYGVSNGGSTSNFRHAWYDGTEYFYVTAASSAVTFSRISGSTSLVSTGDVKGTLFYDYNDTGKYLDPTGDSLISGTLNISGATGGSYGNQLIVGQSSKELPYTLQDTNVRPVIAATGPYPVLHLNHTVNTNTNHGPTIQFTHNGLGAKQWLIGTGGSGDFLDIGFSSSAYGNTNYNPHNGIAGYTGNTIIRVIDSRVGIGGDWGAYGGGDPQHTLDVRGTIYSSVDMRAPVFYDSNDTGYYVNPSGQTNLGNNNDFPLRVSKTGGVNSGCVFFQNLTGDNSWGIVGEFRVGGGPGTDRPSILFSHGYNSNTWSVGFGYNDDNFRINIDHGHRNGGWGTTRMLMDRSGNVTFSGDVTAYSDISVKENIRPIQSPLDKVKLLNGVTYNRTDLEDKSDKIGFIAQDVLNILPEVVKETQDGKLSVAYGNITSVLVEAIKELSKKVEELENKLNGNN